jgi:hypothetical protein
LQCAGKLKVSNSKEMEGEVYLLAWQLKCRECSPERLNLVLALCVGWDGKLVKCVIGKRSKELT